MVKPILIDKEGCRVLVHAQQEARRWKTDNVALEHLLLGLLHNPECRACRVLSVLGVSPEELRRQTEERLTVGIAGQARRLHLTEQSQRVADLWPEEARRLGSSLIGTEHQFLSLIRRADGVVAELFAQQGVREEAFRDQAAALQE